MADAGSCSQRKRKCCVLVKRLLAKGKLSLIADRPSFAIERHLTGRGGTRGQASTPLGMLLECGRWWKLLFVLQRRGVCTCEASRALSRAFRLNCSDGHVRPVTWQKRSYCVPLVKGELPAPPSWFRAVVYRSLAHVRRCPLCGSLVHFWLVLRRASALGERKCCENWVLNREDAGGTKHPFANLFAPFSSVVAGYGKTAVCQYSWPVAKDGDRAR